MSIRCVTFLLSLALAACAPLAARAQQPACTTGNIQTSSGPVCGKSSPITIPDAGAFTANAYLGIPYAQPPVGELRWQNPVAPNSWTAPFQAIQFGNECPQQGATITQGVCSFTTPNQGEDCLYLNVWTPTGATPSSKLPVLVFIHGGAFSKGTGGSSTADLYDGTYLAASQSVIVVTFNYRLGVLGFLATSDMPSGAGNFGFRDQLMALSWVHQNIASFGGDPSQVMLFGESAGAMSVGLHALSSSQSAGLFKAALMESNPLGLPYKTLQQAQALGTVYSNLFQCSNLQCLQQKSACELVAQESSPCLNPTNPFLPTGILLSSVFHWTPVIDGSLISGQPMENAGNLKVPMLMGTNQDEGVLFAALLAQSQSGATTTCPTKPNATMPDITTPAGYGAALSVLFGLGNASTIEKNSRYSCSAAPCTPQLANVITDYLFTCPNRQLAIQAASAQNLYMYLFNQVTSFNFWAPPNLTVVPACQGQVCHADELPYVFNTARAMNQTFQPAEEALSQTMGGYWASFAKSQSPGSAWPLFNPNNKTYLILNANSSTANDALNAAANCQSLWNNIGYQSSTTWDRLLAEIKPPKKKPAH
jgi:carboxylesterase type B